MKKINDSSINNIVNIITEHNKNEIITNASYLEWLEKYTEKHPYFTDNDYKNKSDTEKIQLLSSLYNIIENYAKDNYIYINETSEYSGFYRIKYNNIGYEIGYIVGLESVFFCNRTKEIDDTFIDFENIMFNIKQPHTDEITYLLDQLKLMINNYYKKGVPLLAIKRSINESLKDLNSVEKKDGKELVKKYGCKRI